MTYTLLAATTWSAVLAFAPNRQVRSSSALKVAVDPTTVTKKEYEDICGTSFDDDTLEDRLQATNYLYPKHVEVIEDIAPIAGAMVDEVVRDISDEEKINYNTKRISRVGRVAAWAFRWAV